MKLIIGGENLLEWMERAFYRGAIGIFYSNTGTGILAFLIFGIVCLLTVIGLVTVLKWLMVGRKTKEDPGKKWLRTGKL